MKYIYTENGEEAGDVTDFPADEFDVDFGTDDETGIDTMSDVRSKMGGVWYDLQGRRVENPAKGLYINRGRKVVIK